MTASRRVAVVTGAGSGIGRGVAIALGSAGYDVVLAGRRLSLLEETAKAVGEHADAVVVQTDVGRPDQVKNLFETTATSFGRCDVLFNNAGQFGPRVSIEDVSFEDWSATLAVNLTGMFLCTQAAIKLMKAQEPRGGRIINNGSISAHAPRTDAACYTASKHGVTGLTKQTALDGRRYDVACGQIDVGNAATGLVASPQLQAEGTIDVAHVADAVLYMANLPLDTNVLFLTVMATKMPYVGRG